MEVVKMHEIIIDEEFRGLLPVLDTETYRLLEENIQENGCRDPLVVWNNILVDGYNRYRICTENDIPYNTVSKEFDSREEVLIWIISNQVSRRNLTPLQLSHFRGLHYRADKRIVTNSGRNQYNTQKVDEPHNEGHPKSLSTAVRLAKQYKVSRATIERDSKLSRAFEIIGEISPEAKSKLLSGEVAIDKKKLEALTSMSNEEIEAIVTEIDDGSYKRRTPAASLPVETRDTAVYIELTDTELSERQILEAAVQTITNGYNYVLQQAGNGSIAALRPALRSYTDSLEDLLRSL